jgi:hypothetical protein
METILLVEDERDFARRHELWANGFPRHLRIPIRASLRHQIRGGAAP